MVNFSSFMRGKSKWDSEAQEKGMKSLQEYLKNFGRLTNEHCVFASIAWLIMKDDESQKWFVNLIGDHVKKLQDEIMILKEEVRELKNELRPTEPG